MLKTGVCAQTINNEIMDNKEIYNKYNGATISIPHTDSMLHHVVHEATKREKIIQMYHAIVQITLNYKDGIPGIYLIAGTSPNMMFLLLLDDNIERVDKRILNKMVPYPFMDTGMPNPNFTLDEFLDNVANDFCNGSKSEICTVQFQEVCDFMMPPSFRSYVKQFYSHEKERI